MHNKSRSALSLISLKQNLLFENCSVCGLRCSPSCVFWYKVFWYKKQAHQCISCVLANKFHKFKIPVSLYPYPLSLSLYPHPFIPIPLSLFLYPYPFIPIPLYFSLEEQTDLKCYPIDMLLCEIPLYWAAYAAKNLSKFE